MKEYKEVPTPFLAGILADFAGIEYFFLSKDQDEQESAQLSDSLNPVCVDKPFRTRLIGLIDRQDEPLIYLDDHKVVYLILNVPASGYLFFGPMALQPMDRVELHRFYRNHGIKTETDKPLPILSVPKILQLSQLAAGVFLKRIYTADELLKANTKELTFENAPGSGRFHLSMREEDREHDHHSYQEERKIVDAVAEGRGEDAVRLSMALADTAGEVAAGALEQTRRMAVISITVCTRAAISGGISPTEAYQISDFYIQRLDQCTNEASLTACRNEAIRTMADQVRKKKTQKAVSTYVEACCDYIGKHYREKIYLDELAQKMGISPTYLSRLFSKEKGITLQDYVVQVRVERAANLLTYSDNSIADIGDYVNFPSQSYFGKIFKKYKGMTPKQYRDAHKPKESQW